MDRQRIRVGDLVRIHKPRDVEEYPTWADSMDAYDDTCAVVSCIRIEEYYKYIEVKFDESLYDGELYISDYRFNENWLTLVQHAEDQDFEVGDEVIIHKPANARRIGGKPCWQPEMDKYDGLKTKIVEIDPQPDWNLARMEHCKYYSFNLKWLEHAEDVDVVLEDNDLTDFLGGFVHG